MTAISGHTRLQAPEITRLHVELLSAGERKREAAGVFAESDARLLSPSERAVAGALALPS